MRRLIHQSSADIWHTKAIVSALNDNFMEEIVRVLHKDPDRVSSQLYLIDTAPDYLFKNKYERENVGTYYAYATLDQFYLFLVQEETVDVI